MLWYLKFILKNTHQENSRKKQQDLFIVYLQTKSLFVNNLISESNDLEEGWIPVTAKVEYRSTVTAITTDSPSPETGNTQLHAEPQR